MCGAPHFWWQGDEAAVYDSLVVATEFRADVDAQTCSRRGGVSQRAQCMLRTRADREGLHEFFTANETKLDALPSS